MKSAVEMVVAAAWAAAAAWVAAAACAAAWASAAAWAARDSGVWRPDMVDSSSSRSKWLVVATVEGRVVGVVLGLLLSIGDNGVEERSVGRMGRTIAVELTAVGRNGRTVVLIIVGRNGRTVVVVVGRNGRTTMMKDETDW
jgi:hypothetical protein